MYSPSERLKFATRVGLSKKMEPSYSYVGSALIFREQDYHQCSIAIWITGKLTGGERVVLLTINEIGAVPSSLPVLMTGIIAYQVQAEQQFCRRPRRCVGLS